MMKYIVILLLLAGCFNLHGQKERKYIRQGNDLYDEEKFNEAEIAYRKALEKAGDEDLKSSYNLGNAIYKQENYEQAVKEYQDLASRDLSPEEKAKIYHNLGNSFLQANKIKESIEAYKEALRHNPNDMETKYNLAFAQRQQNQQQQNQQQQDQQQEQQEQEQDQQQQDQQQQDQQQQDQQQQDQQQQQQQQKQDQGEEREGEEYKISEEDAERLLQAIENEEKKLLEEIQKAKIKKPVKSGKDW
ncbi:MAG: tetratricopeptide repeat protein [Bacteroidales bacterium]